MNIKTYSWLIAGAICFMAMWSWLATHFEGLAIFGWTPVFAIWCLVDWFNRRAERLPSMPQEHELDRELRQLIEQERGTK